jgi:hypothetical protein
MFLKIIIIIFYVFDLFWSADFKNKFKKIKKILFQYISKNKIL